MSYRGGLAPWNFWLACMTWEWEEYHEIYKEQLFNTMWERRIIWLVQYNDIWIIVSSIKERKKG
jgi:hypothetical protein